MFLSMFYNVLRYVSSIFNIFQCVLKYVPGMILSMFQYALKYVPGMFLNMFQYVPEYVLVCSQVCSLSMFSDMFKRYSNVLKYVLKCSMVCSLTLNILRHKKNLFTKSTFEILGCLSFLIYRNLSVWSYLVSLYFIKLSTATDARRVRPNNPK